MDGISIAAWELLTSILCACGGAVTAQHLGWQIRLDIANVDELLDCMTDNLLHSDESVVLAACACTLQLVDAPRETSGFDAMQQIGQRLASYGICSALVALFS